MWLIQLKEAQLECAVYKQAKVEMLEMFGGLVHSKMFDGRYADGTVERSLSECPVLFTFAFGLWESTFPG